MKIIGITGPTGAGKTTALRALKQLGVHIIDADAVYHGLLEDSASLRKALSVRFGDIFDEAGKLDRKKLGTIVFADEGALLDLNHITHQFVSQEIDRQLRLCRAEDRNAAIDAIALVESGLGERCDQVVGVLAPEELRVRRIMVREGIPEEYARKRVGAQKGESFFRAHCDHILENSEGDTPEDFQSRALALFQTLLH